MWSLDFQEIVHTYEGLMALTTNDFYMYKHLTLQLYDDNISRKYCRLGIVKKIQKCLGN